jgi:tRNA(fMet)-specific endonuclease VapC
MLVALDTSAYSHFRKGHPGIVKVLAKASCVLVSAVVLGELEAAFRKGARVSDNRAVLHAFLSEDFVEITETNASIARRYGAIFDGLRRAGTPIPINDVWIAAAAMDAGANLLTFDQDFARIEHLEHTLFVP